MSEISDKRKLIKRLEEIKDNMSDKERIEELQAKLFEQEQMLANLSYEIMMSQMKEGE